MQGAFIEHQAALARCGAHHRQVRTIHDLETIEALIIPGGESTTIGKLLQRFGLLDTIRMRANEGMPIWGTCAGMILLAKEIVGTEQIGLNLMNIAVRRNAFGRQLESFETVLQIEGLPPSRAVFIRAPYVERIWGKAQILSRYGDKAVMVREDNLLATAFHPELTDDASIHRYFLEMLN